MDGKRGIIMIGNCIAGKLAMMHRVLEHCSDINFTGSIEEVKKLNMSFETTVMSTKEEIEELKQALQRASLTFNGSKMYIDEAKEMFEEIHQVVIHEKPQSKFISKPRHNFRKR